MQLVDNLLQLMLFSYILSAREVIIMLFSLSEHQHRQLMKAHSLLKTILFSSFVIIKASRLAIRTQLYSWDKAPEESASATLTLVEMLLKCLGFILVLIFALMFHLLLKAFLALKEAYSQR